MLDVHGVTQQVGDRVLFRDVSFEVRAGQTVVVTGPSGVGKSCLLRAIAGLDAVASGTCTLDGETGASMGWPAWRRRVTYVAQTPAQAASAQEWLEYAVRLRGPSLREHAYELATHWGIAPDRWRAPWAQLSGGERQRVWLATAMATAPDVLLLDEPTAGLDHETTLLVEASLTDRTTVWVTHDTAQADRIGTTRIELS